MSWYWHDGWNHILLIESVGQKTENVSGYACNHGSPSGERDTVSSRGHYGGTLSAWPVPKDCVKQLQSYWSTWPMMS